MQLPKPFIGAIGGAFVTLQLLFLANMAYLYGTSIHNMHRYSTMKLLFVDYDQDIVGQSVMAAYDQMKSPAFPTLEQHSSIDYPTEHDVRQAVCEGNYWGAIFSNADASSRLAAALSSPESAREYDNTQALTYVWNGGRYTAYAQTIYADLMQLVSGAADAYDHMNGTAAMATVNVSNPDIASTLLAPISSSSIDLKPTNQGSRMYYNTVSMVMPILQQFFFIMALNGLSQKFQLFSRLSLIQNVGLRIILSIFFTFIGSLCMTGYIYAFQEDWGLTGGQFALTWMAIWLMMHLNFFFVDFATAYVPMQFVPFFILTWIILNVSSTIIPFELSPGFYRWGYALPAYELYQILIQIWTHGCEPRLYQSLPILWAWWVVCFPLFVIGMRKRCMAVPPVDIRTNRSKVRRLEWLLRWGAFQTRNRH